ncbi:hypothetical protein AZH53_05250 [Methanomicrobiaceae archaeon CYW5]|uniref:DUF6508 domain-containing protein n=1 Tax=Methanovulcanius yangii TaxID=1789227 RepID=UPI0029CA6024|nr:DUF6508 domain-containing protein [Methanovulcanius yangii]MBT8507823.1 hypothetical protein [Methanovulcanius yangii]
MNLEYETPTRENFEAVLAYRTILDGTSFLRGYEDEIIQTGTCPPINTFVRHLYNNNWLINTRWQGWADEATAYFEQPSLLTLADTQSLRRILTVHVRIDRMMPGEIADLIRRGYMLSILNRISEIYETG